MTRLCIKILNSGLIPAEMLCQDQPDMNIKAAYDENSSQSIKLSIIGSNFVLLRECPSSDQVQPNWPEQH